jgi:S1-C subfamily serine protease
MSQWYVRDRGRKLGPYSQQQVLDLRARGQVQGYHEVSRDGFTWTALDLTPDFAPPSPPPPPASRGRPSAAPVPVSSGGNGKFYAVVGLVLLLLVGGSTALGVLLMRSGHTRDHSTSWNIPTGSGSKEVIHFHPKTPASERTNQLTKSVGLVVSGAKVKRFDGSRIDIAMGNGSGFVISPDGYLLTNDHVVRKMIQYEDSLLRTEEEKKLKATIQPCFWVFFGRENKYEAKVIYTSSVYDLAIIKVDLKNNPFFSLCHTSDQDLPILNSVYALGYPKTDQEATEELNINNAAQQLKGTQVESQYQDASFRFTQVSGCIKKTQFKIRPSAQYHESMSVNHTASIEWGNSGGPLIAEDGTVIGINTNVLPVALKGANNQNVNIVLPGQNYSLTLHQMRREIDKHVPGVVWRSHPE